MQSPVAVTRHQTEFGEWETFSRPPAARLRPYVARMDGHVESASAIGRVREVPWAGVVMILNMGTDYTVEGPGNLEGANSYGSFAAGVADSHVFVQPAGLQNCAQVNFTPIGARLFFDMPMSELTNRAVDLRTVMGADGNRFVARIDDTPSWDARFDIIESMIESRIAEAGEPSPLISWAWRRLDDTNGRVNIASLADEGGWSRKHLAVQFREHLGVPPKTMARILRFQRARELLETSKRMPWADIALRCGYYDQAHFNRDFRQLAGTAPGEFLARRIPNGGVRAD